jgi:hypothetical protein
MGWIHTGLCSEMIEVFSVWRGEDKIHEAESIADHIRNDKSHPRENEIICFERGSVNVAHSVNRNCFCQSVSSRSHRGCFATEEGVHTELRELSRVIKFSFCAISEAQNGGFGIMEW